MNEEILKLLFPCFVGEISDIQLSTHELTPLSQLRRSAPPTGNALFPAVKTDFGWISFRC